MWKRIVVSVAVGVLFVCPIQGCKTPSPTGGAELPALDAAEVVRNDSSTAPAASDSQRLRTRVASELAHAAGNAAIPGAPTAGHSIERSRRSLLFTLVQADGSVIDDPSRNAERVALLQQRVFRAAHRSAVDLAANREAEALRIDGLRGLLSMAESTDDARVQAPAYYSMWYLPARLVRTPEGQRALANMLALVSSAPENDDLSIRRHVAATLLSTRHGIQESADALLVLALDADPQTRHLAAMALELRRPAIEVEQLEPLAAHADDLVRRTAYALGLPRPDTDPGPTVPPSTSARDHPPPPPEHVAGLDSWSSLIDALDDRQKRPWALHRLSEMGTETDAAIPHVLARIVHEGVAGSRRDRESARGVRRHVSCPTVARCPGGSECVRSRCGDAHAPSRCGCEASPGREIACSGPSGVASSRTMRASPDRGRAGRPPGDLDAGFDRRGGRAVGVRARLPAGGRGAKEPSRPARLPRHRRRPRGARAWSAGPAGHPGAVSPATCNGERTPRPPRGSGP